MESPSGEGQWQGPGEQWESRRRWLWEWPRGHEAPAGCPARHPAPSSGGRSRGIWTERQALCNIKPPSAQSLHGLRALFFTLLSSQTKRGPRLEPAGEPQALPLRLWRPSPPPSPSGPGGAPLHSGSHLFPLHRRAAHQAMSKSRSWYHFRDGTHRAPRTHPAARVLIQRREDMAGRQAGSTAQKLCQWRLWVPSPAGWSQVSPFLPRSVTPGSHGWEKLCSQGLWPRGTKGLTQPCWGRKVWGWSSPALDMTG